MDTPAASNGVLFEMTDHERPGADVFVRIYWSVWRTMFSLRLPSYREWVLLRTALSLGTAWGGPEIPLNRRSVLRPYPVTSSDRIRA